MALSIREKILENNVFDAINLIEQMAEQLTRVQRIDEAKELFEKVS